MYFYILNKKKPLKTILKSDVIYISEFNIFSILRKAVMQVCFHPCKCFFFNKNNPPECKKTATTADLCLLGGFIRSQIFSKVRLMNESPLFEVKRH